MFGKEGFFIYGLTLGKAFSLRWILRRFTPQNDKQGEIVVNDLTEW